MTDTDIELKLQDTLIDYGGLDARGTYSSGQYELLVSALSHLIATDRERAVLEARIDELEHIRPIFTAAHQITVVRMDGERETRIYDRIAKLKNQLGER